MQRSRVRLVLREGPPQTDLLLDALQQPGAGGPALRAPDRLRPIDGVVRARLVQLAVGCVVLGVGVALLLRAALGSDGYSTLVYGFALSTGLPFAAANGLLGAALVALAWTRGVRPGVGTLAQPLIVGVTVSGTLPLVSEPTALLGRVALLLAAFALLVVGIVVYLGSATGAGPPEAAALAFDPPVAFRWSYSALQGGGALAGWLLGADVGVGTLVIVAGLGPAVDLARRRRNALERDPAARTSSRRSPGSKPVTSPTRPAPVTTTLPSSPAPTRSETLLGPCASC